ncbi:hypothetical protein LVD15_17385 [Fulvivirga maritima]|nr:hypothetical protein [Fulvivirga maritima]UII25074.1 hypothetical protein LVD15_17385 [Fulvivirga maritima]
MKINKTIVLAVLSFFLLAVSSCADPYEEIKRNDNESAETVGGGREADRD